MNFPWRKSVGRKSARGPSPGKLTLLPLVAATYFMVSGGPYGLEDVVRKTGYQATVLILLLTPLLWSVPTAMMVSELASAIPAEGGFYVWVGRGMGRFWGFQESWLTLTGSLFDMALYPTLFVSYLAHFAPTLTSGYKAPLIGLSVIAVCTIWNIRGARAVGGGSLLMAVLLLGPFLVLTAYALVRHSPPHAARIPLEHADILGGILIAMWNYMGWDGTSTIAEEVDRPERTYPLAMLLSVPLVVLGYIVPISTVARAGIDPNRWSTGGWVDVGRLFGGEGLAIAIAVGGVIGALGTFNALMLSNSRLPLVMAQDGYLPAIFARCHPDTGAPLVAITACAIGWAACLFLGFERLVVLDVFLSGLSILLEFWALVALRIREPHLPRPYRVPGGLFGAIGIGIPPLALMVAAILRNRSEPIGPTSALSIGLLLIGGGPLVYLLSKHRTKAKV